MDTGTVCLNNQCDNLIGTDSITVSQPTSTEGTTFNVTRSETSLTNTETNIVTSGTATSYIYGNGYLYKVMYDTGDVGTATSHILLPGTASVGDSGDYTTLNFTAGATETCSWRLDPGYNGDGIVVFTIMRRDNLGNVEFTQEIGHTIKPDGTVFDITITTVYSDGTLVSLQGLRI